LKNLTFLEVLRIPFSNAGVAVERYFTEQPSAKEICVHFLLSRTKQTNIKVDETVEKSFLFVLLWIRINL